MLEKIINVAQGKEPADLIIRNANIVNVFSEEIHKSDVAIVDGKIASVGKVFEAVEEVNIEGKFLSPAFIDGHVHIESSMLLPSEFARAVVPSGTTTIIADPHEIANVMGLQGISFIRETTHNLPMNVYVMLPSCVPATEMETSGYQLSSEDLSAYINQPWVLGIAEMMNFPGVLSLNQGVLDKIRLAGGKRVDGHAPAVFGPELCAYVASGVSSDHECTSAREALEKIRLGMYLMIREGTVARDLEVLLPAIRAGNSRRCLFVTDDRYPQDLICHINCMVASAVEKGLSPINAIQMASINTAEYFKIPNLGAIAPGYRADMLVLDDLSSFKPVMVFKDGKIAAKNGKFILDEQSAELPAIRGSVNVKWIEMSDFKVKAKSDKVKTINIIPGQLITGCSIETPMIVNGHAESNIENDVLKIAVIERHRSSGNTSLGFVKGFGLREGAIASTVAHDSHNMIIIGTNDEDMYYAAIELVKSQGGKIVVNKGKTLSHLPLPIAGLISDQKVDIVIEKLEGLTESSRSLGCTLDDPFMSMAFLSLPVIPELKITDKGLIDVNKFEFTSLFV